MDKKIDYKKLRDFRVDKDLKQKEIAAKLNIVPSAYSRIERGERGMRVEQLKVVAEFYGKNINEFLKEKELNGNSSNSNMIKNEIELFESIFCMISADVEQHLFEIFNKYEQEYESAPFPYEEYIKGEHICGNPDYVMDELKKLIKGYEQFQADPIGWHNKIENETLQFRFEGDIIPSEEEKHEEVKVSDYLFSRFFGIEAYELLKDKNDEWLKEFVTKKENYEFVWCILNWMYYQSPENLYSAFKDMMKGEPIIRVLFQYGLLEKSWFSDWGKEYLQEANIPFAIAHAAKGNIVERVSDKMEEIFTRRNKSDFYMEHHALL